MTNCHVTHTGDSASPPLRRSLPPVGNMDPPNFDLLAAPFRFLAEHGALNEPVHALSLRGYFVAMRAYRHQRALVALLGVRRDVMDLPTDL
jgi:hypothetical protein